MRRSRRWRPDSSPKATRSMSRDPHVEAISSTGSGNSRFARLTSTDLMFLRLESTEWPAHFGSLAVLEGAALQDEKGRLRLHEIRDRLDQIGRAHV